MTQAITYCASGCTVRGQHLAACPCRPQHDPAHDDHCRGCQPRLAEHGVLCAWCSQRLAADVAASPALVAHLREIGEPFAQTQPPSDGKSYRDPAEGSMRPAAWDAADELHALLACYAHLVLDEHPDGRRMAGPDENGTVRSVTTVAAYRGQTYLRRSSVSGLADSPQPEREWHDVELVAADGLGRPILDRHGERIVYLARAPKPLPPAPSPADATARLVRWLMPLLPWCTEQEWAPVMRAELAALVATTSARWPTAQKAEPERAVAMPCPKCGRRSLVYAPPSFERQPFKVSCSDPDCARIWTEDEWAWLVNMVTKGERAAG